MITASFDTSAGASFALYDGNNLRTEGYLTSRGRSSDGELVPWLVDLVTSSGLALEDIKAWTVGTGPGSFSGIRVGISLIKGICAVTGAKLRGMPSSLALAAETTGDGPIAVLHDARRQQFILSPYERRGDRLRMAGEAQVIDPDFLEKHYAEAAALITPHAAIAELVPESLRARLTISPTLQVRHLATAPETWPEGEARLQSLEPVYVRPAVFVQPRELRKL